MTVIWSSFSMSRRPLATVADYGMRFGFPLTTRAMKVGRRLRRTRQWLSIVLGAGARHRLRIRAEWRLSWMTREHRAFRQTRSADVGQGWRAQASKCLHSRSVL